MLKNKDMKYTKRILVALVTLLTWSMTAGAQTDRIKISTEISNGTVTTADANPTGAATVTLTVTPAQGYYVTASDITVTRTALGAQAPRRTPGIDESKYAVTAVSVDATGKGTYCFNIENGYGAYVEATFKACMAITPVVVISEWTYGSAPVAPVVTPASNPGNGAVTFTYKVKGAADDTYVAVAPKAVGNYTVRAVVAAAGHYLGNSATADFAITAKTVKDNPDTTNGESQITIELGTDTYTYDGTEKKPAVTVKDGDNEIPATEYNVVYSNNINASTTAVKATVTITDKDGGNYIVNGTKTFVINKATLTTVVLENATLHYTGSEQTVTVKTVKAGELVVGEDNYTVTGHKQTMVGNYQLTVTAKDNTNFTGSKTADWSIIAENASSFTVSGVAESYVYTGKAITPDVTVKMGDILLTKDKDYTIEYSDNIEVGTATITVKGKGGYVGTNTLHFDITRADAILEPPTPIMGLKANGSDQVLVNAGKVTGGTLEYSLDSETWSQSLPKGNEPKTYTVYYRVIGDKNHKDIAAAHFDVVIAEPDEPVIDRTQSGIRVVRNDNGAEMVCDAFLTVVDGKLCIDQLQIVKPEDATPANPVSVTVYVPTTLQDYDGTKLPAYGMAANFIVTDVNVPVSDVYMPDTNEAPLNITGNAIMCNGSLVTVHTTLLLLDDYAKVLTQNVAEKKVVTEITQTTEAYWTFSSPCHVELPNTLEVSIVKLHNDFSVTKVILTDNTISANHAVLLKGEQGATYQIKAVAAVDNTFDFSENLLEVITERCHLKYGQGYYILYQGAFHAIADDDAYIEAGKVVLHLKNNIAGAPILEIMDGGLTGVKTVKEVREGNDDSWYSLDGRKLEQAPTAKGLYIHRGRKTVIK